MRSFSSSNVISKVEEMNRGVSAVFDLGLTYFDPPCPLDQVWTNARGIGYGMFCLCWSA